jgi:hypothetical protein
VTRTGPDPALRDHYERLRQRALGSLSTAETSAGYGLLRRRGMLAWMRTCAACTSPGKLPAPVASPASSTSTGLLLAPEGEAELVQVLTTLILSSHVTKPRPLIQ